MSTIYLTSGNDAYEEEFDYASHDTIFAGAGDDQIFTFGSLSDRIYGGDGNDTIFAYADDDLIFGGAGNDLIYGGHGNDRLQGDAGDDVLADDFGNDLLIGGAGNDELRGGRGDDTLLGGFGDDWLEGGKGRDTYLSNSGPGDHDSIVFGHDGDRWQLPNHFNFRSLDSNHNNRLDAGDRRIDTNAGLAPDVFPERTGLHVNFDTFTVDIYAQNGLLQLAHSETVDFGSPL